MNINGIRNHSDPQAFSFVRRKDVSRPRRNGKPVKQSWQSWPLKQTRRPSRL